MKKPVCHTIDDCDFEFFPLSPDTGIKVLVRLTKIVGEPLGLVGDALKKASGETGGEAAEGLASVMDMDVSKLPDDLFAKCAKAFVDRLSEAEMLDTVRLVLNQNTVMIKTPGDNGTRKLSYDKDFAGNTSMMLKAFAKGLEVNFADFFGGFGVDLGTLAQRGLAAMTPARRT